VRTVPGPTRRRLLAGLGAGLLAGGARPGVARAAAPVAVGAIRWDAWQAPGSPVTAAMERNLSPPRYRHRLPFFAQVAPDGRVAIDGGTQAVMDQEINLALRAGLSYWGFLGYPREGPMSAGLRLYLSSARRGGLRFCMLAELAQWGGAAARTAPVPDWHLELFRHPDYQRVLGDRPLYFLGFLSFRLLAERWGGVEGLRAALDRFRARAPANPYVVLMSKPEPGLRWAAALGVDAIGAYAIAGSEPAAPYAALAREAERRWDEYAAAAGLGVVPTVMTGWDRRPRIENPVPWEPWQHPGAGMDRFYEAPRPEELAAHLRRGLDWIEAHPRAAAARAALVYAWNEHDEGGWLAPTLPFDTGRIEAVRRVLCAPGAAPPPGCR
jgi:hypothetical protein